MTSLQYVSNLFLNFYPMLRINKQLLNPVSQNLVLLGNICSPYSEKRLHEFLEYASINWKNIYYILGPLEYSSFHTPNIYTDVHDKLYKSIAQYSNITILNNSTAILPNTDITLLGTTLWLKEPYMTHQLFYDYSYIFIVDFYSRVLDQPNRINSYWWWRRRLFFAFGLFA